MLIKFSRLYIHVSTPSTIVTHTIDVEKQIFTHQRKVTCQVDAMQRVGSSGLVAQDVLGSHRTLTKITPRKGSPTQKKVNKRRQIGYAGMQKKWWMKQRSGLIKADKVLVWKPHCHYTDVHNTMAVRFDDKADTAKKHVGRSEPDSAT
jgi:hypothetical protein